jgi:hypothetical protein
MTYWMMFLGFKVKVDLSKLQGKINEFKSEGLKDIEKNIKGLVIDSIKAGSSPVNGQGSFQDYSKSYTKSISKGSYREFGKRKKPVNLTLSGDLLNSFKSKITSDYVNIVFDNVKFNYHNGSEAKVKRRLLPTNNGEIFKLSIMTALKESLVKLFKKIISA